MITSRTSLSCGIAALFVCAAAGAHDVEIVGVDGTTFTGNLTALTPELVLESDAGETTLALSDVLFIRPLAAAPSSAPSDAGGAHRFELSDGSTFTGRIAGGEGRSLEVRVLGGQSGRLNLSGVRSILALAAPPAAKRKLDEMLAENLREDVAIVLRGGAPLALRGSVRGVTADGVTFQWRDRKLPLPWRKLSALALRQASRRTAYQRVVLLSGDVFAGEIAGGNDATLNLRSVAFPSLVIAWKRVGRVECRSTRIVFLSDVRPASYEFDPYFVKKWPVGRDRSLTGKPLRLGGRVYEKGLVLKSRSVLVFAIGRRFKQLAGTVGILDEMQGRGDAAVAIIGDGRTLWENAHVRGGQPPLNFVVDVNGVQELALVVDYGADLDLSDHVCFALPRLIR